MLEDEEEKWSGRQSAAPVLIFWIFLGPFFLLILYLVLAFLPVTSSMLTNLIEAFGPFDIALASYLLPIPIFWYVAWNTQLILTDKAIYKKDVNDVQRVPYQDVMAVSGDREAGILNDLPYGTIKINTEDGRQIEFQFMNDPNHTVELIETQINQD